MKMSKPHLLVAAAIGLLSLTLILADVPPAMGDKPVDVNVVNPIASPVPVVTVPIRELHQESKNATFTEPSFTFDIDVPSGKRLIVESASVRVRLPPGQRAHASVGGNFSTGVGTQFLSLSFQGTFDGQDVYTTTQPVRLYVNPAGGLFSVVRTGAGSVFAEVSFAGYLEEVT
jgi:hypothetical protein